MKNTFFAFCLCLLCTSFGFSQEALEKGTPSVRGTYQIELINTRSQPYIPQNLEQIVIDNRHETKISYVQLGTNVRLKIAPLSEINRPSFKAWEEFTRISE